MESLTCGYNMQSPVLSDINLEFDTEDGLICIIGPNGVGKSTLIRCIDNLIPPLKGRVTLDGVDVRDIERKELASKIGYVQTIFAVQSSVTVFEAIMMGRYNHMRWKVGTQDLQIIDKAISIMGLESLSNKPVNELSAGQYQKVMIARGLVQDTEILILDEPTSNLDIRAQMFVASLLKEMAHREHKLVIMICHDVNIASKTADKILMLTRPGKVLAFGIPKDVITEDNIKQAYRIGCDITEHEGRPSIMIRSDSI